jgi:hypothetical protein
LDKNMKREAKSLHTKAVDSLVLAVGHFNRCWDRGRAEAVLIFLDRAFEPLMKSVIVAKGGSIRDKRDRALTIGSINASANACRINRSNDLTTKKR